MGECVHDPECYFVVKGTIDVKDLTIGAALEVTLPVIPAEKVKVTVKMAGRLSLRVPLEAEMRRARLAWGVPGPRGGGAWGTCRVGWG
jgi:hypothetical protein